MTLTRGDGPLASHGPETVNYTIDGPKPIAGHVSFLADGVEVVAATGSNVPIE